MNPYDTGPSAPLSHPEWFTGEQLPSPPPRRGLNRKAVGVIVAIIVLLGAAVGITLLVSTVSKPQCLDAATYQDFTGEAYEGTLNPTENFYTYTATFKSGSTTYDDSELPKSSDAIKAFGIFYKDHSAIPQTYTLTAVRIYDDNWYLAQDRMDILKQALVSQGIPEDKIVQNPIVTPSVPIGNIDDPDGDASEQSDVDLNSVTIRITSTQKCSQ